MSKEIDRDKLAEKELNRKRKAHLKELVSKEEKKAYKEQIKREDREAGKRTFSEKFFLTLRKKWLTNTISTVLIIVILCAAFLLINLLVQKLDLPEIDVTKNKIYTLSDESKSLLKNLDETVSVYVFGFNNSGTDYSLRQDNLERLLKQYVKASDKIKYEIITEESNKAKVTEYELLSGYDYLIFESATSHKLVSDSDLVTYDYTAGQKVYLVEETITNSIFGVTDDKRPKVYFVTGHGEMEESGMFATVKAYMTNENIDTADINLMTASTIPDDCSALVITSPESDYMEGEVSMIKNFINRGGNILVGTITSLTPLSNFTNLQSVLDIYGATIENNGYIFENDLTKAASKTPYVIAPTLSVSSIITQDLSTAGAVFVPYAGRVTFDKEFTEANNITTVTLANSSASSVFITDLQNDPYTASSGLDTEESTIIALASKTIKENDDIISKAIFMGDLLYASDYVMEGISGTYPMSYFKNNKDMFLNSVAFLAEKENVISIRKNMSTSTYLPTEQENRNVFLIIFAVPIAIMAFGVAVGVVRRRKK